MCVLSQPDLADGEDELIIQDIVELQKELHRQVMFLMCYYFWMLFQILFSLSSRTTFLFDHLYSLNFI